MKQQKEEDIFFSGSQAEAYIHSLPRFVGKPTLERIKFLMDALGNPEKKLRFVHVAGTNGKGSICTILASVLRQSGYKTGLFTSPYITCFRERFQINGSMMEEEELAALAQKVKDTGIAVTEFEFVTAVAMLWFSLRKCEIVCLEVGLGGRFDATNCIEKPLVSVIANIGLDHTAVLGDSLGQIAFEKCGILKQDGICVCYPKQEEETLCEIMEQCAEKNNTLILPNPGAVEIVSETSCGSRFSYGALQLALPLAGRHQIYNCLTAIETVFQLQKQGFTIGEKQLLQGIENSFIPARMEVMENHPLIVVDGAHNPQGLAALDIWLRKLEKKPVVAVCGVLKDKALSRPLQALASLFTQAFTVTPPNPRAQSSQDTAKAFLNAGVPAQSLEQQYRQALRQAKKAAGKKGAVIIFGSLYLAQPFRDLLSVSTEETAKNDYN